MINLIKNIIKNILGILSIPLTKLFKRNPSISVLIFHHVDKKDFASFKKLMIRLDKEVGFIDPSDLDSLYSNSQKITSKKILLTFDDGFLSNYYLAKEVLDLLNIKALFFVMPNFANIVDRKKQINFMKDNILVNESELNNNEMSPMSYDNLRELIINGHSIGSHSMNHSNIAKIKSNVDLNYEIIESKLTLEKELNININHFAFPFGDSKSISNIGIELANQNYKYIYSGIRGINKLNNKNKIQWREPLHLENNIFYNLFVSFNGISFKDKNIRNKIK